MHDPTSASATNSYEDRPLVPKLRFLIVDDHPDGRFLAAKTLLRKFPTATIVECTTGDEAFGLLDKIDPTLIIAHRTVDFDGISLIKELRLRAPSTLLMMSSGVDRREAALAVGADAFL